MATNEDLFRREEDRKWRESVDHQLVTLITGHQVLDRRIDDLQDTLEELDRAVRGDPGQDRAGLMERLHEQEAKITRLWAVIFMDAAGERGMYEQWKKLQRREARVELHWKFLTAVVVAVISTVGLLMSEWPKIKELWPKPKPDKLETMIQNAKRPKDRYHHYTIKQIPGEDAPASNP